MIEKFDESDICKIKLPSKTLVKRVLIILLVLISVALVVKSICFDRTLTIYYGPYSVYTPISLQTQKQKEHNRKRSVKDYLIRPDTTIKVKVCRSPNFTYTEGWWQCVEGTDSCDLNKLVLFANSSFWLTVTKGQFASERWKKSPSGDWYLFKIIGYKKTEKLYYTSRFIWHKKMRFPKLDCVPDNCSFLLNSREESGSTHIVPEVYLLENCGKKQPVVAWDMKQNIVRQCVLKKQIIGVLSDGEYNEQLDEAMKDSLSIMNIMVNIPHDPVVMVIGKVLKDKVAGLGSSEQILEELKKEDAQIIKNRENTAKWQYLLRKKELIITEKDSGAYAKTVILQKMLKYYLSMGIIRPVLKYGAEKEKEKCRIVLQGDDWLGIDSLKDEGYVAVFKTRYGDLENHYYTFDCVNERIMKKDIADYGGIGLRVIPLDSVGHLNELDSLMRSFKSKKEEYGSH